MKILVKILAAALLLFSCVYKKDNDTIISDYDYTEYTSYQIEKFNIRFNMPKGFVLLDFESYNNKILGELKDSNTQELFLTSLPTKHTEFVRFLIDTLHNKASIMIQSVDFVPISKQLAKDVWAQMKISANYSPYEIEFVNSSIGKKNGIDVIRYEMAYTNPEFPKHFFVLVLTKGKKSFSIHFLSNDKTLIDPFVNSIEYL